MKITGFILVISHSISLLFNPGLSEDKNFCINSEDANDSGTSYFTEQILAVDDTFYITIDCNTTLLTGNVLNNDILNNITCEISYVFAPTIGELSFGAKGFFTLSFPDRFSGISKFKYGICESGNKENTSMAGKNKAMERPS